jgi:hypothetical protein
MSAEEGCRPSLYAAVADDVVGNAYYGPGGPFEIWGAPKAVGRTKRAQDALVAQRLWTVSEQLTGVSYL